MILFITLAVGSVFLLALAANCWMAISEPTAWKSAARAKITARATRQRLKMQQRKAQIIRDAERIRQELFEESCNVDGER